MAKGKGKGKGKGKDKAPAYCPTTWTLGETLSRRTIVPSPMTSVERLVATDSFEDIDTWASESKDAIDQGVLQAKLALRLAKEARARAPGSNQPSRRPQCCRMRKYRVRELEDAFCFSRTVWLAALSVMRRTGSFGKYPIALSAMTP